MPKIRSQIIVDYIIILHTYQTNKRYKKGKLFYINYIINNYTGKNYLIMKNIFEIVFLKLLYRERKEEKNYY